MGWCISFAVMLSVAASSPAEQSTSESVKTFDSAALAQVNIGKILQGLGRRDSDDRHGDRDEDDHGTSTPEPSGKKKIWKPTPMPTRPPHPTWPGYKPHPQHFPPPQYQPRPEYTPTPNYIPGPTVTPVPANVLPTQPEATIEPEPNVVLVEPQPNNFLDGLDIKIITPQQLGAFQQQFVQKNNQLGEDLKKLLPGNDKLVDQFIASADKGLLDAKAVQKFVSALGGKLDLPLQLKASGFVKQLVFNNLAMRALLNLNININLLNIKNININLNLVGGKWGGGKGGGKWGGKWGGFGDSHTGRGNIPSGSARACGGDRADAACPTTIPTSTARPCLGFHTALPFRSPATKAIWSLEESF